MMIDIFNHFMPKAYLDRLGAVIPGHVALTAFPRLKTLWDVDARLSLLDEFDGLQQVLSLANPPLELIAPPEQTPALARLANDSLAELCSRHPDRFPAFIASLPMNNIEASLAEIDRAVTGLGARGVQVFTNVAGKPLSAPEFRPIFQRMAAHDLPVWVHPMRGANFPDYAGEQASEAEIWFSFGWPYETTACMTRLIYSGLFDELPDLKIITHHMGGMIPYFAGRINLGFRQIFFGTPERNPVRGRGGPQAPPDGLLQDALCRHRAQRRRGGDALRACLLRHVVMPVRHRRAVRCRAGPRADPQHDQGDRGAADHGGQARDDIRRQCQGVAQIAGRNRGEGEGWIADMKTQNIKVKLRDGEMGAYLAIPDKHAGRRRHRHHGNLGRQRHHAPARARIRRGRIHLPGAGPVLAAGAGRRTVATTIPTHVKKAFDLYYDFDYDLAVRDMEDTWHFLEKLPECNGKVGAVGYCLGGKLCYLMCCRTDIDCAVAYYGTYIEHRIREAKNLHRPFVLHMAMKDRWVQAEVNDLLERRLSPNPLVTIHKYPGADHAFARHGGKTYSKPEADRALALTVEFFSEHLGG